jgi:CheY-like chemotaxis protein
MSKVLILDDERQVIQQVSTLLDSFGYDYDFIPKADFLFRKLDSDDFDLILLDINMAGRDGVSLLRELKGSEQYKDIEVIMMTGETDDRILSECFELVLPTISPSPSKNWY